MKNERKSVKQGQRKEEVTHKIMSSIPSKNTRPEILLRKVLFSRGYRYRINYKKVIGKPDIVFTKVKLAIFVDGDFWHGGNWRIRNYASFEDELNHYSGYWKNKLLSNVSRDKEVNKKLAKDGWIVLRFWESEIKKDPNKVADEIEVWYNILSGN